MTEAGCRRAVEPEAVQLVMREVVEGGEEAVKDYELRNPRAGHPMDLGGPVMALRVWPEGIDMMVSRYETRTGWSCDTVGPVS